MSRIKLDLSKQSFHNKKVNQFDDRNIGIDIFENDEPYSIDGAYIVLNMVNADNQAITQTQGIAKKGNAIDIELMREATNKEGVLIMQLVIVKANKQRSTFEFSMQVNPSILNGADIGTSIVIDSIKLLNDKIIEATKLIEDNKNLIVSGGVATKEDINSVNAQLEHMTNFVYVENFRINIETDTTVIKKAISYMEENNIKGWLCFGKREYNHTGFEIRKPNIWITSEGATLNGTGEIYVHGEERTQPTAIPVFNFKIQNIVLNGDRCNILSFKNCRKINILNVDFNNGLNQIYVKKSNYTQHVNRIKIKQCDFNYGDNSIYIEPVEQDSSGLNATWSVGDIQINSCEFFCPNVNHIYARMLDGIVLTGCTFFYPSILTPFNSRHLDIEKINWAIIQGNNFFESGLESIYLKNFKGVNISNNIFVNSGLRVPSSAIKVEGGNSSNLPNCNSIIANNIINDATKHGIELGVGCEMINVVGNITQDIGVGRNYYGTVDLSSITHYSIANASANKTILNGNIGERRISAVTTENNLQHLNIEDAMEYVARQREITLTNTDIPNGVIDTLKGEYIYLNITTPIDITEIKPIKGKRVTFIKIGTGNVIFKYNINKIVPKGLTDKTLGSNESIEFINIGGVWREV